MYTFFTSKKTLTDNKDVFIKNEENTKTERNPNEKLPDNIKNKMWTDYINELCKKVEKNWMMILKKQKKQKKEEAKEEEAKKKNQKKKQT